MVRPSDQRPSHLTPADQVKGKLRPSVHNLETKDARIRRALELIQPRRPVRVSDVAVSLNLSASGFRHLFKKELGISPRHYLKLTRLERAKKLLESSFLRVKEVAALAGLNDVSHFVRDYKALYRETPSQTRRRQRSRTAA